MTSHGSRAVPVLERLPLLVCEIALQEGETVNQVALGDSIPWLSDQMLSGDASAPTPHVIVKPTEHDLLYPPPAPHQPLRPLPGPRSHDEGSTGDRVETQPRLPGRAGDPATLRERTPCPAVARRRPRLRPDRPEPHERTCATTLTIWIPRSSVAGLNPTVQELEALALFVKGRTPARGRQGRATSTSRSRRPASIP